MNVRIRAEPGRLRSSMSFAASGWVHGSILAWLALSPGKPPLPRTLYEQEIQPHEKRIVWYRTRDRLPDIAPAAARRDTQPPRASEKFNQTIVAGAKDLAGDRQMISMPAPEIRLPEPLPLPNVVAVSPPPRPVKLFTPPVEKPAASVPVSLPDAPRVTPTVETRRIPFETPAPKPVPRAFTPPLIPRPKTPAPAELPDAPGVSAAVQAKELPLAIPGPRAPRRAFITPPAAKPKTLAPAMLPDAPGVVSAAVLAKNLPLAIPDPRAPRRAFTPPPESRPKAPAPVALSDAPVVSATVQAKSLPFAVADPHAPPRTFRPPPEHQAKVAPPSELPAAPDVGGPASSVPPQASLAIVGMNPAKVPDFPTPPGSHQAGFSAGPEARPKGGDAGTDAGATIVVPGLLVRGAKDNQPALVASASPTSPESLLAAARTALGATPAVPAQPLAVRVGSAPDPQLQGRAVYTVAIQMPNVTSYSGSWIVWFAERLPLPGAAPLEIKAPIPVRKVDPKYIAAAAEEKVEGKVRLFAVIRRDGHVDSVVLLRHLDVRLDLSAAQALGKWVFEPALRNGVPVDVDAVFEIPFHLAPRPVK
ncbi:MAG: TonB family protein [Acidobacteriia bacterium]|nr:TonB family protein [Terriglobia bacterium]